MILRPHHLLCTCAFSGHGYSDEFTRNMTEIANKLRSFPDTTKVQITFSADDICHHCPKLKPTGECMQQDKVSKLDSKAALHLHVSEAEYIYSDIRLSTSLTPENFEDICSCCSWFSTGLCDVLLGKG